MREAPRAAPVEPEPGEDPDLGRGWEVEVEVEAPTEPVEAEEATMFGAGLEPMLDRLTDDSVIEVAPRDYLVVPKEVYGNYVLTSLARQESGEIRRKFVENPTAFLPHDEAFDEAGYSGRVVGVGEAPRSTRAAAAPARDWASAASGVVLELPSGSIFVGEDELPALADAVEDAAARGASTLAWRGHEVPVSAELVRALAHAARPDAPVDQDATSESQRPRTLILLIRENELVLEWAPGRETRRAAPRPGLPALAPGTELKSYQRDALVRLQSRWSTGERGTLLCDDMGLGKTLQALAFAAWVSEQLKSGGGIAGEPPADVPVVLVAPPSLLGGWLEELERRLPPTAFPRILWGARSAPRNPTSREVRLLSSFRTDRRTSGSRVVLEEARLDLDRLRAFAPDLLLIGYDTLRTLQFALGPLRLGLLIADEAQEAKDPVSLRSRALRAMNYDFALAMTGTPIENSWDDLWTLCDFACPGDLGSLSEFKSNYPATEDVQEVGGRLARDVRHLMIRRTREDALRELPPCDRRSEHRSMPSAQALAYRAELARHARGGQPILALLQELARISLHPSLRAQLSSRHDARAWLEASARTAVLRECLERWAAEDEAVLVFVRSLDAQATLRAALDLTFGAQTARILNGQVPQGRRDGLVQDFREADGFRVLLVSPDVGGAGWNLQAAARTVLLERPFNPAVEAQMVARTWRLGQARPVQVVAPVAILPEVRTFDVILDALLHEKRDRAKSVLAPIEVSQPELQARFAGVLGPKIDMMRQ